jgi:hypothetical protein
MADIVGRRVPGQARRPGRNLRRNRLTTSARGDKTPGHKSQRTEEEHVANHLTPTELADEMNMKRRDVISKCMELNVPIFQGRIDKTLFVSTLHKFSKAPGTPQTAA